ncbi:chaperone protein HscA [Salmonella enterica subsp. enterica]|uniref:Chaperone protein HscA n=1 Tax=Salmonella enterica I TaxID=59201 RepID=A0A3S5DCB5_SALET|nr:chaperone protein HscA [Salmonella enterica subsp. enterica]
MALLQISEPGLSAAPHQRRLAAGIDLGTTNSLVATVRSGQAETLPDHEGRHLLPSVVHYQQQGHTVGYAARDNAAQDTANTISSVKRMMGRSLADIQARYPHLPYRFKASVNGLPMIDTAADCSIRYAYRLIFSKRWPRGLANRSPASWMVW